MAAQEQAKEASAPIGAWLPAVALAWLVPGGGHMLLKRQGRAAMLMASVTLMFLFGLFMRGSMFTPQSGDLLTILINYGGFVGDMGSGMLYLLAPWMGYNQPDVARHVFDYGTKVLVSGGRLHVVAVVEVLSHAGRQ